MIPWSSVKRVSIDMDFGECALGEAAYLMKEMSDTPQMAVCQQSQSAIVYLQDACQKVGIRLVYLPDAIMKKDGWAVIGERSMIWSSGAS